jgi:hypothetical protein
MYLDNQYSMCFSSHSERFFSGLFYKVLGGAKVRNAVRYDVWFI